MDEFKKHDDEYTKLTNKKLKTIIDDYGCHPPCKYKEMREVGNPTDITGGSENNPKEFTSGPTLVSTTIRTEAEKLICPFETLISNIGGTLGLFLGFSFITIWDWIEFSWKFIVSIRH